MLLSSSTYFVFLAALFFLYWPAARIRAFALALILFANYFFYAKWDLFYLFLIPAASAVDYTIGYCLGRAETPPIRRLLVGLSVAVNVGLLATLKYTPFALQNWGWLTGRPVPEWRWTFALGISFYAFQALTYTIDIYRRDAEPSRSLLAHFAAVSFFPTTLAGPIARMSTLVPQFEKFRPLEAAEGGRALFLIGLGLAKKFLIADYLADNIVNRVFDLPRLYSGLEVLAGVYAYALQLYFDFSGYTDIALGSALLLGIKLPINFNQPYAAVNIADFWRRWHISLSNWLRDYLYFSLPGKRSRSGPYLNLVLTMAIGGLWHGASWNFVVWGLLHGFALALTRAVQAWRKNPPARTEWWALAGRRFATAQFVCFAWIFFRAPDLASAGAILEQIASFTFSLANLPPQILFVMAVALVAHYLPRRWYEISQQLYVRAPFYAQAATLAALIVALQFVASTGAVPFIYTRF
ncbi:MAG: MBOAT family O-acyltransferase [Bryobacteraceae bacterium]|nr:MBOAT family O-acyltransferase [Bryobacteraceae bacterium]